MHIFHTWGEWEEVPGVCKLTRKCIKCPKTQEKKIPHSFGEWEDVPGKCQRKRVCQRCGEEEYQDIPHSFDEWIAIPGKCQKQHVCQRCGKEEYKDIPHSFDKWKYVDNANCLQERICTNCSQRETRISHQLGPKAYLFPDSCTVAKTCARCNAEVMFFHQHQYTEWAPDEKNSCVQTRRCNRCGRVEYGTEQHNWLNAIYKDGEPYPGEYIPLYCDCLKEAIKRVDLQIEKNNQLLVGSQDEDYRRAYIERNNQLELKKLDYERRLNTAAVNVLGDLCTRCGKVINWGITQEDMEKRIDE